MLIPNEAIVQMFRCTRTPAETTIAGEPENRGGPSYRDRFVLWGECTASLSCTQEDRVSERFGLLLLLHVLCHQLHLVQHAPI